jgi:hypothetical protein
LVKVKSSFLVVVKHQAANEGWISCTN